MLSIFKMFQKKILFSSIFISGLVITFIHLEFSVVFYVNCFFINSLLNAKLFFSFSLVVVLQIKIYFIIWQIHLILVFHFISALSQSMKMILNSFRWTLDSSYGWPFVHFLFSPQDGPGFRSWLVTWAARPTLSRGISPSRSSPPRRRRPWRSVRTPSTAAPCWCLQTPPANQRAASRRAPRQTAVAPHSAPWCRVRVQTVLTTC